MRGRQILIMAMAFLALAAIVAAGLWQTRSNRAGDKATASQPASSPAATANALIDARGRAVHVAAPITRIAIDDSRYLVALSLIHPDPVSLLAAWPKDINRLGETTYRQFLGHAPGLADLPLVASSAGAFNVEALLAAKPEVALLSLESGVTDAQIRQIESAGISVVFVDFFVRPFENLENSLKILGLLTGRDEQAARFLAFRRAHMEPIAKAVASLPADARPTVFVEAHAGISADCCNSPGRGNIGDYIDFVGGHNIGSDVIRQSFGKLNLEYVISRDPYVYIATGGPHLEKAGGLVLGPGYDQARERAALAKVASRPGISGLSAVKAGRVHGFSHQLINSPLDIIAIEAFARWIHPELFADIDPAATLATINRDFLSIPYDGLYWVDLR